MTTRRFRCSTCGTWADIPISRRNEIVWRKRPKPIEPLPDQITIYDVTDNPPDEPLDLGALVPEGVRRVPFLPENPALRLMLAE